MPQQRNVRHPPMEPNGRLVGHFQSSTRDHRQRRGVRHVDVHDRTMSRVGAMPRHMDVQSGRLHLAVAVDQEEIVRRDLGPVEAERIDQEPLGIRWGDSRKVVADSL